MNPSSQFFKWMNSLKRWLVTPQAATEEAGLSLELKWQTTLAEGVEVVRDLAAAAVAADIDSSDCHLLESELTADCLTAETLDAVWSIAKRLEIAKPKSSIPVGVSLLDAAMQQSENELAIAMDLAKEWRVNRLMRGAKSVGHDSEEESSRDLYPRAAVLEKVAKKLRLSDSEKAELDRVLRQRERPIRQ